MEENCMTYKEAFRILNDLRYVDAIAKIAFEDAIYVKYSSLDEAKKEVRAALGLAVRALRGLAICAGELP